MRGMRVRNGSRRIISFARAAECHNSSRSEVLGKRSSAPGGQGALPSEVPEVYQKHFLARITHGLENRRSKLSLWHSGLRHKQQAKRSQVWGKQNPTQVGQGAEPSIERSEVYRQQPLARTPQGCDNRRSNPTPSHPGLRHKLANVQPWLQSPHSSPCEDSQFRGIDACMKTTTQNGCIVAPGPVEHAAIDGHVEVGMRRQQSESESTSDAFDELDLLVQRGCHPPRNLFYRVLKRCIREKDLALGKRVHALSVASGYDGDAFLATHLIGLYASHGSLEEAMGVFVDVSTPDAYNWAAIILAYARHGGAAEAAKAIQLYRQMCLSTTVQTDDRLYSAVLKACAAAQDLEAGKEVHAQILKSFWKPDIFVQAGLVNMYAKCGSLSDALKLFDSLSDRNVVTWNAIIAGYAQQGMGQGALSLYRRMQQEDRISPNFVTYTCLLQACANIGVGALDDGKQLHAEINERRLQGDVVVRTSLLNMYAKCGSLGDAQRLFDQLPERNIVAWNAIITGYAKQGMGEEALSLYRRMQREGLIPDFVTYVCVLQACACAGVGALDEGKQVHAMIKERGLEERLSTSLMSMYAKCGSLDNALSLFNNLTERTVVAWNAIIAGYVHQGRGLEALSLYKSMPRECLTPDLVTYVCLLQACSSVGAGALNEGKQLHAEIKERGLQRNLVLGRSLINMYAKCGDLQNARKLFDKLPEQNVVACNAMIAGYAQQGLGEEALSLYRTMQQKGITPDSVTFVCLLQACAIVGVGALAEGNQLDADIRERGLQDNPVLSSSLVNMFAKCGRLEQARTVFDKLSDKGVVTWTAMITGYAQQGMGQEALSLYSSMKQQGLRPDAVTYVCLLQACADLGALRVGEELHAEIQDQGMQEGVVLATSLVSMYAKCGSLQNARRLFDKFPVRNIVAWNAMIAGYAEEGMGQDALNLFRNMQKESLTPDRVTFSCLLQACANVGEGAFDEGKQLHAQIREAGKEEEMALGGSLVCMYMKCGELKEARTVFDRLVSRDVLAWNAMIAGYAQRGMSKEAFSLYNSMQQEGLVADSITYVCLLQACAAVSDLTLGVHLHKEIVERELQVHGNVVAALINMYAKCGSMCEAQLVFDSLSERSHGAWGALMNGYSRQGDSRVVFELFDRMRWEGIQPDEIMFLSVLTVCSHVGLVDKGRAYFNAMRTDFSISPSIDHYVCVVDLLGRAGHLDEALQVAKTMPYPPTLELWRTLLGACQKWKNVEIGRKAFKGATSLDETDASAYILMSNIYASTQTWDAAKQIQKRQTRLRAWKKPGLSWWTDMSGVAHTFIAGDKILSDTAEFHARLEQLVPEMKNDQCPS